VERSSVQRCLGRYVCVCTCACVCVGVCLVLFVCVYVVTLWKDVHLSICTMCIVCVCVRVCAWSLFGEDIISAFVL